MRISSWALTGALFATACGGNNDQDDDGRRSGDENSNSEPEGGDGEEEDLTGGFQSCEEALVGHGYDPWVNYVEDEDALGFTIELTGNDANPYPWVATLTYTENEPGYRVTCTDLIGAVAMTWVDAFTEEVWTCAFSAQSIAVESPEEDPNCSKGFETEAYLAPDIEFLMESPGLFVSAEE